MTSSNLSHVTMELPSSFKHNLAVKLRSGLVVKPVMSWEVAGDTTVLYVMDWEQSSGARPLIIRSTDIVNFETIDEKKPFAEPREPSHCDALDALCRACAPFSAAFMCCAMLMLQ